MYNNIIDNYSHPDRNLKYVKESIFGPGVEEDFFFDNVCGCGINKCNNENECYCLLTYGQNYENGLMKNDPLNSKNNVFECSRYCCCCATCNNSVVQNGPSGNLVIQITENKGYGVFACINFPKGAFICEYAGEIVGHEEAERRMQEPNRGKYVMHVRERWEKTIIDTYVDAFKVGNIGRYINHSCDPNCVLIPVRAGKEIPMICVFTSKAVAIGEELTYFYCLDSTVLSSTPCHCGSQKCFKFIPSI